MTMTAVYAHIIAALDFHCYIVLRFPKTPKYGCHWSQRRPFVVFRDVLAW